MNKLLSSKKSLIVLIGIGYITYISCKRISRLTKLPPGPIGWPWIGYIRCLGKNGFEIIQTLCGIYGPIMSFRLCGNLVVIFNDLSSIKEAALNKRSWAGRYTMLTNHFLADGKGISNYETRRAQELRQVLVRELHRIILSVDRVHSHKTHAHSQNAPLLSSSNTQNKPTIEEKLNNAIEEECENVINILERSECKPLLIGTIVRKALWKIVWIVVFGKRCPLYDKHILQIIEDIAKNNSENGPFQLKQALPAKMSMLMKFSLLRRAFGVDEMWNRYNRITETLRSTINLTLDGNEPIEDCLIARFLKSRIAPQTADAESELVRLAFELLAAGTDTSTLTVVWACHCLAEGLVPVGPGECFTEASLDFVHRYASVVPLALPHLATFDNYVGGYFIPKGSIIFFNLYSVHSSQLQESIRQFSCPVNQTVTSPHQVDAPIPFSLGSRSCPGHKLASSIMLRLMSTINKRFKILSDTSKVKSTIECRGLTNSPPSGYFIFKPLSLSNKIASP